MNTQPSGASQRPFPEHDAPAPVPPEPVPPLAPPTEGPVQDVTRSEELARLARTLRTVKQVAIDTEANSLHAYYDRTCVVQISSAGSHAIIDALAVPDLTTLRDALDRPDVEVLFHGGDYDISVLTRDHQFSFHKVFDTMIAATLLGIERVGLADLVQSHFGVTLDKAFQRADWGKRPMSPEQRLYLHRDTLYLEPLADFLRGRLHAADLVEEAEIEFRRLASRKGSTAVVDPEGWRKAKGSQHLDPTGRAVLAALWSWREGEAQRRDRPPFKVVGPRELVALAQADAREARALSELRPLPPALRRRYGTAVLRALDQGRKDAAAGRVPEPDTRPQRSAQERAADKERRLREEALKAWRRKVAQERRVPNVVVLPNPALQWLLESLPTSPEQLLECQDLGPKRVARYGDEYLKVLRGAT